VVKLAKVTKRAKLRVLMERLTGPPLLRRLFSPFRSPAAAANWPMLPPRLRRRDALWDALVRVLMRLPYLRLLPLDKVGPALAALPRANDGVRVNVGVGNDPYGYSDSALTLDDEAVGEDLTATPVMVSRPPPPLMELLTGGAPGAARVRLGPRIGVSSG
jgi:hypothetical protein